MPYGIEWRINLGKASIGMFHSCSLSIDPSRQSDRHDASLSLIALGGWIVIVPFIILRLVKKSGGKMGVGGRNCLLIG
eukprot:8703420-Heterocapsa_arctica.AAC.1